MPRRLNEGDGGLKHRHRHHHHQRRHPIPLTLVLISAAVLMGLLVLAIVLPLVLSGAASSDSGFCQGKFKRWCQWSADVLSVTDNILTTSPTTTADCQGKRWCWWWTTTTVVDTTATTVDTTTTSAVDLTTTTVDTTVEPTTITVDPTTTTTVDVTTTTTVVEPTTSAVTSTVEPTTTAVDPTTTTTTTTPAPALQNLIYFACGLSSSEIVSYDPWTETTTSLGSASGISGIARLWLSANGNTLYCAVPGALTGFTIRTVTTTPPITTTQTCSTLSVLETLFGDGVPLFANDLGGTLWVVGNGITGSTLYTINPSTCVTSIKAASVTVQFKHGTVSGNTFYGMTSGNQLYSWQLTSPFALASVGSVSLSSTAVAMFPNCQVQGLTALRAGYDLTLVHKGSGAATETGLLIDATCSYNAGASLNC